MKSVHKLSHHLCILLIAGLAIAPTVRAQSDSKDGALNASERSSIMFDINLKRIRDNAMMKDFNLKEMMQQNGIPADQDFDITKVNRLFGGVQIPTNMADMQPQPGGELKSNFFVRFEFSDAAEASKMMESVRSSGSKTHEIGGKTYLSPDDASAPSNLRMHQPNDITVEMGTERYVLQPNRNLINKTLAGYWKQIPKDAAIRLGVDLESNRAVLDQMMEQAKGAAPPEAAQFLTMVDDLAGLTLGIDFESDKMLSLQAIGKDSEGTEKLRLGIDGMLGMGKFFGQQGISQMDEKSQKVFGEILKSLKATADGNTVRIDIMKPEGFDEVVSGMIDQ